MHQPPYNPFNQQRIINDQLHRNIQFLPSHLQHLLELLCLRDSPGKSIENEAIGALLGIQILLGLA